MAAKSLTTDAALIDQQTAVVVEEPQLAAEEAQEIEKATAPIQASRVTGEEIDQAEPASTDTSAADEKTIAAELVAPQAIAPQLPEVPEPAPVVIDGNKMDIAFVGDCWVQIKDADNRVLLNGVYGKNQQFTLEGKAPFRIKLGAPKQAVLTYKGEKVDLSRYASGKLAKLTLPQE